MILAFEPLNPLGLLLKLFFVICFILNQKLHIFSEMNCVTFAVLSFQLWNATYAVFIADSVSDPFISGTDPTTSPVAGFVTTCRLNH